MKFKNEFEIKQIEKLLGFRIVDFNKQTKKIVSKTKQAKIVDLKNGERIYVLNDYPEFSLQEAELIVQILKNIQLQKNYKERIEIAKILEDYCKQNYFELEEVQKKYFEKILKAQVFGLGPLSQILEDEELEEITVIGTGKEKPLRVFHRIFGWLKTNFYYANEAQVKNTVNKIALSLGRQLSLQQPNLNANLKDGSRMNAIISPMSFTGPTITIRKFKKKPFHPINLLEFKTVSAEALAFLWLALQTDSSLLIAGNTGSGKTTTLNAIFNFVEESERIIVTEETPEIHLMHKHLIKLNTVENLQIKMKDLITETLRMRPDRIIVGEIRNSEEVEAFIDTLLAGQGKGSYATFHALSSNEVIKRMKKLGILEMDLTTIDLILVQRRWNKIDLKNGTKKEIRRITEISELVEGKKRIEVNKLFEYDYLTDKLVRKNSSKKVKEKILHSFGFTEKEFKQELRKREKFLAELRITTKESFFEKIREYK